MCAKKAYPLPLTIVELLLRGWPHEFLDLPPRDGGASPRQKMTAAAERWIGHPSALTADERERIRAVWLDGQWRPSLEVTTERSREIRGHLAREERVPA